MKMIAINSSNLARIGWENNIMIVEFHSGTVYQYSCTEIEFNKIIKSPSIGESFAEFKKSHTGIRV